MRLKTRGRASSWWGHVVRKNVVSLCFIRLIDSMIVIISHLKPIGSRRDMPKKSIKSFHSKANWSKDATIYYLNDSILFFQLSFISLYFTPSVHLAVLA